MPDNKNLLNLDDLADVFAQLNDIEDAPKELTEEEKASQRNRIFKAAFCSRCNRSNNSLYRSLHFHICY